MKLYSIRHKISGKFLVNVHPVTDEYWTHTGPHFWKTIDGILSNLKKLSGEKLQPDGSRFSDWWSNLKSDDGAIMANGYHVYWSNFDPAKLEHIEVIVTNVSVLGEESFPASDFILETEVSA